MPEPSPTSGTPDTSQANPNQQQNPQHNPQYGQYGAYGPYGQPGQHYPWPRDMPRQGNPYHDYEGPYGRGGHSESYRDSERYLPEIYRLLMRLAQHIEREEEYGNPYDNPYGNPYPRNNPRDNRYESQRSVRPVRPVQLSIRRK
jgi:hypothetical protein